MIFVAFAVAFLLSEEVGSVGAGNARGCVIADVAFTSIRLISSASRILPMISWEFVVSIFFRGYSFPQPIDGEWRPRRSHLFLAHNGAPVPQGLFSNRISYLQESLFHGGDARHHLLVIRVHPQVEQIDFVLHRRRHGVHGLEA